ncbi:hypothetical protein OKW21_006047 [Catalinimonas alkaloidigena]|uniref:hypothetical protein n=1 Tax=Catalinimonas alkaloidigena TaxID=1075417 RepID=UPI00240704E1|nr:hypothetical protein [Catalinimonas alkaloidigena]MDF9800784.1 hypothetical protein [Catalinimonas alkaloidigena]
MSITSNYVGTLATPYISKAILGAPTLDTQMVQILPNIKYKTNIGKRSLEDFDLKPYQAKFSGTSKFSYSEFVLEPWNFTVHIEEEKRALIQTWEAEKMTPGAQNTDFTFDEWLVERMGKMVSKKIEKAIWSATKTTGTTTNVMDAINGYETILSSSAGTTEAVKITGSTLTASNIADELAKVYEALHELEIEPSEAAIYMSRKAMALYKIAGSGQMMQTFTADQPFTYLGMSLFESHAIDDDSIIAGMKDNFYLGTDLVSDYNQVRVVDHSETTQDDIISFRLDGSVDTKIAYPEEVVYRYNPA